MLLFSSNAKHLHLQKEGLLEGRRSYCGSAQVSINSSDISAGWKKKVNSRVVKYFAFLTFRNLLNLTKGALKSTL